MNKSGNDVGNFAPSLGILLVSFDEPKRAQQVKYGVGQTVISRGKRAIDGTCQPGELIQTSNIDTRATHLTCERW